MQGGSGNFPLIIPFLCIARKSSEGGTAFRLEKTGPR